ncbi:hypothetical protein [Actinomyces bowdenii]|uniref:hypothetical protein n=1 Tax=Actinomyces bowdenii TaxID=131109 RepID=UPI00163AD598|nr:hypothetical protein [Actinomyces bowdenii]
MPRWYHGRVVVVIEHHQAVIFYVDGIIDLGPGSGTPADLVAEGSTLTGRHLAAYLTG